MSFDGEGGDPVLLGTTAGHSVIILVPATEFLAFLPAPLAALSLTSCKHSGVCEQGKKNIENGKMQVVCVCVCGGVWVWVCACV